MDQVNQIVAREAEKAGFSRAGIAPVPVPGEDEPGCIGDCINDWIEKGYAGEMDYLKRRDQQGRLLRSSPRIPFPWVRSVIVCATNYHARRERSIDPAEADRGWIAQYAWTGFRRPMAGTKEAANLSLAAPKSADSNPQSQADLPGNPELEPSDYHDVLLGRLRTLDGALHRIFGPFESRCYVDTGPVVERFWAKQAGVGWTGKNTCTINQGLGSWLFLGVILTGLELSLARTLTVAAAVAAAVAEDRCGSCTRCIEACPTGALVEPYRMDASLCISYLTIEKRGAIPEHLRSQIGRQVFGCDICQEVCPWNRRAPISEDAGLAVRSELVNPALDWLGGLDAESFRRLFRHSPVSRAKLTGLLRNVAIAMGNSGLERYLPRLREWSLGPDPVLAEAAGWAIRQLQGSEPQSPGAANGGPSR